MAFFRYEAIGPNGQMIKGRIEATDEQRAKQALADRDEIPIRLSKVRKAPEKRPAAPGLRSSWFRSVGTQDLILFSRQFSTMVRVGISASSLLSILKSQTEHPVLRSAIGQIENVIQQGGTYSDAFSGFPRIFPSLYCSMVRAGEVSGTLPDVMDRLIDIMEHELAVRKEVKKALQYPKIVLFALFVSFIILLIVVFPRFAAMYMDAGMRLPLPTRICMALSRAVMQHWILLLVLLLSSFAAISAYFRTPSGMMQRDRLLLRLPLIAPLIQKATISRFSSMFAVMQSHGMNVLESMQTIRDTVDNQAIVAEFDRVIEQLAEGAGLASPMRTARYFTPMLVNMVSIGEETGDLPELLRIVSRHYDVETRYAIDRMIAAIGPILTVLLAVVVGFFALAIYMPMWDMVQIVR